MFDVELCCVIPWTVDPLAKKQLSFSFSSQALDAFERIFDAKRNATSPSLLGNLATKQREGGPYYRRKTKNSIVQVMDKMETIRHRATYVIVVMVTVMHGGCN